MIKDGIAKYDFSQFPAWLPAPLTEKQRAKIESLAKRAREPFKAQRKQIFEADK